MKDFWNGLMEWKTAASYLFTGIIILGTIVMLVVGESVLPITVIISAFIFSTVGAFIQFIAFTDRIIKKARYSIRMIIFAVPSFILLAANAFFFRWFPLESGLWLTFCFVFLSIFLGFTIGFEVYYHAIGKKYDGLLGEYRKKKALENANRTK